MRSFYRKRKIIFVLLIVVGILSLSSITYAIFTVTTSQSGTNKINSMECLELTFSNQENNINLVNTYPMTDERGAKNTPYIFTITNNCGTYIEYSVGLMPDNSNTLEDKYVKTMFSLKDDVGEAILLTNREEGKIYNDNKTYLFRRDGLANGASKEYKLRLWVDGSGIAETVANKSFNSKIIINSYPKSEEGKIIISADLDGGHLYQELNEVYRTGDKVKLPIPAKEGHSFKAWEVVSGDGTINKGILTVGSEDITIKATYKVGITVTLNLDGGSLNQVFNSLYYEEDEITLEEPTKDGYTFTGWEVTSGDGIINDNTLTIGKESNVVKAIWEANFETLYETLSYIESNGTQYIDTMYKPNQNTKIEILYNKSKSDYAFVFGSRTSQTSKDIFAFYDNSSVGYFAQFYTQGSETKVNHVNGTNHLLSMQNGSAIIDGTSLTVSSTTSSFSSNHNIYLFALNQNGSPEGRNFSGKIYYFKIYENNELLKHFIPVRRKNDNTLGMYDLINEEFYLNSGTGNFMTLPDAYEELNYLESTGVQFIDTLYKPNQNTRAEIEYYKISDTSSDGSWIFGSRTSYTSSDLFCFFDVGTTGYWAQFYTNGKTTDLSHSNKTNHVLAMKNGCAYIDGNNSLTINSTTGALSSNHNLYLFGLNQNGVLESRSLTGRIYYFEITENNTLIKYFIPVKRKSDNTLGMYDLVNNEFYLNAGSSTFTGN